jgi:hypothetical protein
MFIKKGNINEEITIKLLKRDVLLLMVCIDLARNHAKGGTFLFSDLEYLREKIASDSISQENKTGKTVSMG